MSGLRTSFTPTGAWRLPEQAPEAVSASFRMLGVRSKPAGYPLSHRETQSTKEMSCEKCRHDPKSDLIVHRMKEARPVP